MKTRVIGQIGKALPILAAMCVASVTLGADSKETMCVKQKNGTYKCKASGKIEKKPCCSTPENRTKATPKPK